MTKAINVQYFALFREETGLSEERIKTDAVTAGDLYDELRIEYSFRLPQDMVRAAINMEFQPMDTELKDEDHVVFIPPVAGG